MLIAVDHGNKQIKTVHTPPFTSGLIQSDTPGFGTDALAYRGKYYTLTCLLYTSDAADEL